MQDNIGYYCRMPLIGYNAQLHFLHQSGGNTRPNGPSSIMVINPSPSGPSVDTPGHYFSTYAYARQKQMDVFVYVQRLTLDVSGQFLDAIYVDTPTNASPAPGPPDQGLYPWTPLGALPPDPGIGSRSVLAMTSPALFTRNRRHSLDGRYIVQFRYSAMYRP